MAPENQGKEANDSKSEKSVEIDENIDKSTEKLDKSEEIEDNSDKCSDNHEKSSVSNSTTDINEIRDTTEACPPKRYPLTVAKRRKKFEYDPPIDLGLKERASEKVRASFACSCSRFGSALVSLIPILSWLPKYNLKKNIMGDFISGFTVAIMHIPQGMSYAMLAELDPIIGIYMAFFPVLVYAIFGTSRHISIGTMSVICLMTGKVVTELGSGGQTLNESPEFTNSTVTYSNLQVATIMSFAVGFWEIVLGVLRLGSLSVFLSEMLVSGFSTGAAVHVVISQIKHLLGLHLSSHSGPFKIILTCIDIFQNMLYSNVTAVIVSAICITIMAVTNEHIKPRVKKKTSFPVPIELLLIIIGTVISYYCNLNSNFDVIIVGKIPTGLPTPTLPPLDLFGRVLVDAFGVSMVGYTLSFSMAKMFSLKQDYSVNPTQELYAQGASNFVGSIFSCAPVSACMSRSLIQEAVGGVTQLTSFICCGFILIILLFIGPLFEHLPNCVLASIIVVALKGMFMQTKDMLAIWKLSKLDAFLWIATFTSVVVIDIDYGLMVGVAVAVIILLTRNQTLRINKLGMVPGTDIYLDVNRYKSVKQLDGVCICEVQGCLHFANRELFKKKLIQITELDPNQIAKLRLKHKQQLENQDKCEVKKTENGDTTKNDLKTVAVKVPEMKYLIVDLKGVGYIDLYSSKMLQQLYKDYEKANIDLYFCGISERDEDSISRSQSLNGIPDSNKFHSLQDAVDLALTVA